MTIAKMLLAVTLVTAAPLAAQDTVIVRGEDAPPPGFPVEQWAVEFFNRSTTMQIGGDQVIADTTVLNGNVGVFNGRLVVEGVIEGTLVAINADVEIRAGARIGGNVLVLGGELLDDIDAEIGGTLRRHSAEVDVTLTDGLLILNSVPRPRSSDRGRPSYRSYGRSSILISLGNTYNRVEGLPLRLGIKFVWGGGDFETRLRGYGVFRTAGKFKTNRNDMGYNVDWAFRFGRQHPVTLTARAYDLVIPTQPWPLEIHEVGWATFLWHRDYRDYFLQRGFSGRLAVVPVRDLTLAGEYAHVEEDFIAARDPWTPFRNNEPWRDNPTIDDGDYDLVRGTVTYDSRPARRSRRSGWFLHGRWEHVTGTVRNERPLPSTIRDPLPTTGYSFDGGTVDVRRYQRVGRSGQLRLRGMWSGRIAGDPTLVQRRYSLGGPDPMNGYAFREFACNELADPAVTGLCDNVLLFQGEFRGRLSFDWFSGDDDDFGQRYSYHRGSDSRREPDNVDDLDDFGWFDDVWFDGPTLVLLSNAGTGWLDGDPVGALNFDVGAGIEFGGIGFYVSKAIKENEPVRVTLRIARRF